MTSKYKAVRFYLTPERQDILNWFKEYFKEATDTRTLDKVLRLAKKKVKEDLDELKKIDKRRESLRRDLGELF